MKLRPPCLWLSFVIGSFLWQPPLVAQAQNPAPLSELPSEQWNGIQRLHVNLTSQASSPFVTWNIPAAGAAIADNSPSPKKRSAVPPAAIPNHRESSSSPSANAGPILKDHQQQLRDSLARDGQSSLEGRDSLTREAMSVIKWTIVTLLVGSLAVVGMKKFSLQKAPVGMDNRIRVLETLPLGRQQSLKLAEVGGERFLIASDQGGIKSVTLLPSWPSLDPEEEQMPNLHFPSPPRNSFEDALNKVAA